MCDANIDVFPYYQVHFFEALTLVLVFAYFFQTHFHFYLYVDSKKLTYTSLSMNMFSRKPKVNTSQIDENRRKTATKVLDVKKDLKDRLKHLKVYIETNDVQELKQFFDQNYSQIFYIFYESFVNVESMIKQKLSKTVHQDLNDVLFVFLVSVW